MLNFLKRKKFRGANELFSSGKIFEAKDKELYNILKKIASKPIPTETTRHREIIRALIILTIKGNRDQRHANRLNFFLSIFIIILSTLTLKLTIEQTNYAEIQSRSDRIKEANSRTRAIEYCKQNQDSPDSGLAYTATGEPAPCSEVLKLK